MHGIFIIKQVFCVLLPILFYQRRLYQGIEKYPLVFSCLVIRHDFFYGITYPQYLLPDLRVYVVLLPDATVFSFSLQHFHIGIPVHLATTSAISSRVTSSLINEVPSAWFRLVLYSKYLDAGLLFIFHNEFRLLCHNLPHALHVLLYLKSSISVFYRLYIIDNIFL
jgi:hypothetical protein